ncbi:MAG TPA: cytochrome c biogenesis protein ResB [Gemmataceae bacterium]|nr:cytochrome c biogenesis protein ResB [Gemmataceae bacterium]
MEQTATKQPTGSTANPTVAATNGSVNGAAAHPAPHANQQNIVWRCLEVLADLRITVALFALAMLIVFWGTLAQQDFGVWTIVNRYFRSFLVWVPLRVVLFNTIELKDNPFDVPFPGGWLIGSVMVVNLIAAHIMRFKFTWSRGGIILIHAGILIMMISEVITGVYAIEGQLVVQIGMTSNSVIHPGSAEFAVTRHVGVKDDEQITVPRRLLASGAVIDDPRLPFVMKISQYMVNCELRKAAPGDIDHDAKGHARVFVAVEKPEVSGVDPNQKHDIPAMYADLFDRNGKKLGKYLFCASRDEQWIKLKDADGKETDYQVVLRFKETQRDFSIHLDDFKHDVFPGTNTPRDFHSYIRLTDEKEGIVDRKAEIYMNAPMTYKGETFYQSQWTTDPLTGKANGTVLQVVRNPGWAMPYIACLVVGLGMLWHFGITLQRFVDRRIMR